MNLSDGLAQLRTVATAKAHEASCDTLRAAYGKLSPGRAVVCMYADRIEDDVDRVLSQIEAADKRRCRELVMLIDCPGGRLKNGVCEALSAFKGRTVGVVVGRCSSAATLVLASCKERIAPATAEFLIHCGGYYKDGRYSYDPSRWTAKRTLGRPMLCWAMIGSAQNST